MKRTLALCRRLLQLPRAWISTVNVKAHHCVDKAMASLRRTDSKTPKPDQAPPPPRSCIICTESEGPLLRPCRTCSTDYCGDCLAEMFIGATTDKSRMPPRCCNLLQLHTAIDYIGEDSHIDKYRRAFEEWMSPVKTYCPSARCSVFIPDRNLPAAQQYDQPPRVEQDLSSVLAGVVEAVAKDHSSRFFRGEPPIDQQSGYTAVVQQPM
jgi:hypothetical protein